MLDSLTEILWRQTSQNLFTTSHK